MKLLLKMFFIFFLVGTAFSQEYHPLLNNSSWIIYDQVSCCQPSVEKTIEQGTDEVFGNKIYKKFMDPFSGIYYGIESTVYLREDVLGKKVYKLENGNDVLLYDFNLENSNTISLKGKTFIATVDYINVIGGTRKRITLNSVEPASCGETLTQIWIEGVGSNRHPFYPDFNMDAVCSSGGGINIFTKCSFQNDEHVYGNSDCSLPETGRAGIYHTDVDCSSYRNDDTKQLVEQICYTTKSHKVQNVKLGQFYYYTSITAPSKNFIVDIVQEKSNDGLALFGINQKNQIVLWDATCAKVATGVEVKLGLGRIYISNAKKGEQYVLSAKYNCKSIVGASFSENAPVCTYKFISKINGENIKRSNATIDLVSNCSSLNKIADRSTNLNDVEVYPMPFKDQLSIKYNFETNAEVKIEIFDIMGRLLSTQSDKDIYINKEFELVLNFAKQSNQMYLIKITSDNETIFKRVFSK